MLNSLILGDNLEVLKSLPDNSVDLCYIDPPFFSNRNYAVIWGDKGEVRSFEDCWDGGVDTYINWMYKRVEQIHRILKPTGSFYLHCDWHADAELKVYVCDKIFSNSNFRNRIIWQRANSNTASNQFGRNTDTIFFYSKSNEYSFNQVYTPYEQDYIDKTFKNKDEKGQYQSVSLTGAGVSKGEADVEWKNYKPSKIGRHWAVPNKIIAKIVGEDEMKTMSVLAKLELLEKENYILWSKSNIPRFKYYLKDLQGVPAQELWKDISNVQSSKEAIGYPTQKPEALLERIIKASSNEGDVVLDCFMGGGTTISVAQKLGRNWIGIDQSPSAFGVTRERIVNLSTQLFPIEFEAKTAKWDWDNLRQMDDFEFETLGVKTLGGILSKTKKGGDLGIDGILNNWSVISVKRSENVGRNVADNLRSAILRFRREKSVAKKNERLEFTLQHGEKVNLADYDGFIVAFSFGKGLKSELAQLEREEGFKILPLTVEDILPVAKKPKVVLKVECQKMGEAGDYKFIATATTDDQRLIEFFAFKIWVKNKQNEMEILASDTFNKTGIFEYELKKGEYQIAAAATDEFGLTGSDEVELVVR